MYTKLREIVQFSLKTTVASQRASQASTANRFDVPYFFLTDSDDCSQDIHEWEELHPGHEDVGEVSKCQRKQNRHHGGDGQEQGPEK